MVLKPGAAGLDIVRVMAADGPPSGTGGRSGAGRILDASLQAYRAQALNLWKIVALIVVPARVLSEVAGLLSLPGGVSAHDGNLYTAAGAQTSTSAAGLAISVGISVVAAALAIGALSKTVLDHYTGRAADWRSSLSFARQRLASLLWLSIISAALLLVGFLLFIVPGVWLLVALSTAVPALMFEAINPFRALSRSVDLVHGRWWATFGSLLIALLLVIGVQILIDIIFGSIESGLKVDSVALVIVLDGISGAISALISYPFLAIVCAVIYIDLRTRKEGLDVDNLARGIGAGRLGS